MRVLRVSHSAVVDAWRDRERRLRDRDVDVHLVSARAWDEGGRTVALEPRDGEDVVGLRTLGSHPNLFVYDPVALWRELGRDVDVLDLHEEPFALATAEILAVRALRRALTRKPASRAQYVLYSAQNLDKRYPPPFRWFERAALRGAGALSVCNAAAGRIARRKGLRGAVHEIPLGLDPAVFRPDVSPAADPAADDTPAVAPVNSPVTVGYAGRLEDHKGVRTLLDAVRAAPRLRLRVAGDGPLRPEVERAARATARIELVGSLDAPALAAFYRSVDALAVPSRETAGWVEQFGRVAVEAMACGTPVVATATGALPDVVADAGLLIAPDDPAELADALLRVVDEPGLAAQLRAAGLARAATCTWDAVADAYLDLYTGLVGGHRVGGPSGVGTGPAETSVASQPRSVEIIVVAYGRPDLVANALAPVAGAFPITVVDNSSSAEVRSVAESAGVRYIDPGRNGGFAAGVNVGLADRLAPGADVLLLNPDATVSPDDVALLAAALAADDRLASVGPRQVDDHGVEARVAWPFPHPGRVWLEAIGLARLSSPADYVIGSVLLLRAEAIDDVGLLDESYFLYAEETDWARRAVGNGWRHTVVPDASAMHLGGATSDDDTRREQFFHASQERYYRKHFGTLGWQVARAGQVAGSTVRGVVLRGDRGRAARRRAALYARGPVAVAGPRQ